MQLPSWVQRPPSGARFVLFLDSHLVWLPPRSMVPQCRTYRVTLKVSRVHPTSVSLWRGALGTDSQPRPELTGSFSRTGHWSLRLPVLEENVGSRWKGGLTDQQGLLMAAIHTDGGFLSPLCRKACGSHLGQLTAR